MKLFPKKPQCQRIGKLNFGRVLDQNKTTYFSANKQADRIPPAQYSSAVMWGCLSLCGDYYFRVQINPKHRNVGSKHLVRIPPAL